MICLLAGFARLKSLKTINRRERRGRREKHDIVNGACGAVNNK
jgi:hypothetical protein